MQTSESTRLGASAERMQRDIDALAEYRDPGAAGWTREVFTEPYRESRQFVRQLMEDAGLEVRVDAVGNIIGRLAGKNPLLKTLLTGSHTDTVHAGGRFDGIVGVLGAIEVVRLLGENNLRLERDLLVVDYLGEESNPYQSALVGSAAIAGSLTSSMLARVDDRTGLSMAAAMESFGLDPNDALTKAVWQANSVHASVELHVEQGPVLERSGTEIGVVTAIVGSFGLIVDFQGRSDHSGTRPMNDRQDAMLAAAEAVLAVEREACGAPIHAVGTTTRFDSRTEMAGLVPDHAKIWVSMRSVDAHWLSGAQRRLADRIAQQAAERGVEAVFEMLRTSEVVETTPRVQDIIAENASRLGYTWESVPSGAGHDSKNMAQYGPMGMIFVPSVGGRSHVPEEFTHTVDIVRGVEVLAATLLQLDRTEHIA